MNKTVIYGVGALGLVGLYLVMKNQAAASLTPAVSGAPQGAASSSPSTLYSLFFPQAARADNNPALNNQPYAQKPPTGGGTLSGVTGWASAAGSVASAFQSIFGSTASDGYSLDVADAGQTNMGSSEGNVTYADDLDDYGNDTTEMWS